MFGICDISGSRPRYVNLDLLTEGDRPHTGSTNMTLLTEGGRITLAIASKSLTGQSANCVAFVGFAAFR